MAATGARSGKEKNAPAFKIRYLCPVFVGSHGRRCNKEYMTWPALRNHVAKTHPGICVSEGDLQKSRFRIESSGAYTAVVSHEGAAGGGMKNYSRSATSTYGSALSAGMTCDNGFQLYNEVPTSDESWSEHQDPAGGYEYDSHYDSNQQRGWEMDQQQRGYGHREASAMTPSSSSPSYQLDAGWPDIPRGEIIERDMQNMFIVPEGDSSNSKRSTYIDTTFDMDDRAAR